MPVVMGWEPSEHVGLKERRDTYGGGSEHIALIQYVVQYDTTRKICC